MDFILLFYSLSVVININNTLVGQMYFNLIL